MKSLRNTRVELLLSTILLVILSSVVRAGGVELDSQGNLFVLSIGINKYHEQRSGVHSLNLATNDAEALSAEFGKRGKFLYGETSQTTLVDESATRANI